MASEPGVILPAQRSGALSWESHLSRPQPVAPVVSLASLCTRYIQTLGGRGWDAGPAPPETRRSLAEEALQPRESRGGQEGQGKISGRTTKPAVRLTLEPPTCQPSVTGLCCALPARKSEWSSSAQLFAHFPLYSSICPTLQPTPPALLVQEGKAEPSLYLSSLLKSQ